MHRCTCKRSIRYIVVLAALIYIILSSLKTRVRTRHWNSKSIFLQLQNERWKYLTEKFHFIDFQRLANPIDPSNRTIVFQCVSVCGGLADRLRGLLMAYLFALLSNRQLVIDMQKPCRFDDYFQSHIYKWISNSTDKLQGTRMHIQAIDHNEAFVNELKSSYFIEKWSKYDHIILSSNIDFTHFIFSNPHFRTHPIIDMFLRQMLPEEANIQTLFPLLFEVLLQPTERMVRLIDQLLADKIDKQFVCVHLRIGKNPSNPTDWDFGYSENITKQISDFISEKNLLPIDSSKLLFVSSDSSARTEQMSQLFVNRSFFAPGPILQIDLPVASVNCDEGFSKVVTDFYLFGECDTNILTSGGFSAFGNRRRLNPYQNLFKYNRQNNHFEQCLDLRSSKGWEPARSVFSKLFCPIVLKNKTLAEIE